MKPIVRKITNEWIKKHNPCREAVEWWDKKEQDPLKILDALIQEKKYDWANWFIVRVMTYHDYVSYAVFAAEQVIDIYEKKYPDDDRPRKAIEAAKRCIVDPSPKNKWAAEEAAFAAERPATSAATWAAACAAAWAATTETATWAATDAATWAAACAAAWVAFGGRQAMALKVANKKEEMQLRILNYGMSLLTGGEE